MSSTHVSAIRAGTWFVAAAALLSQLAVGCDAPRPRRTDLFERAERHYRRGEYDTALDQYQAFLDRYPRSRLADTARLRVQTLTREVNSMLDRKDMPQPRYVGGGSERSSPSSAPPPDSPSSPSPSSRSTDNE